MRILLATISLVLTVATPAADAKIFKASGSIIRLTDTMLLLRTSVQDIEITHDAKTKVNGQLAKGSGATVIYDKVAGQPARNRDHDRSQKVANKDRYDVVSILSGRRFGAPSHGVRADRMIETFQSQFAKIFER